MLYDHAGNPIKSTELTREVGAASVSSVRSPHRSSQATGIRPTRLASLLRQADEGDTDAFFTLAQEIEERDTHYDAVLRARKMAVSGAEVHIGSTTDKRADRKIADACRELISCPEFEGLVFDLLDGIGKGISLVEIIWKTDGNRWAPCRYEWREQRFFTWDRETLSTPLLVTQANPMGEPLAPGKWCVHRPKMRSGLTLRGGLARAAVTIWMLKSYNIRDLMAFLEQYGMPIRVGKYDVSATPDQQKTLLEAVTNIGSDAGATIPDTMSIEFIQRPPGSSGSETYIGTVDFWNGELSKLVLGQTMTTENGSSQAQASVHERKELTINRADARAVAATIRRDVLAPFVAFNFGPDAEVPRLFWKIRSSAEQAVLMANVTQFVNLGGEVEQSVIRDELGLPDPPIVKPDTRPEDMPKLLSRAAPATPVAAVVAPPEPQS